MRDLLSAPWLQLRGQFPEDGEAHRFNKVGDALDMSHVQLNRYLAAADYALRQAMAKQVEAPQPKVTRYYARDQRSFTGPMKFSVFNLQVILRMSLAKHKVSVNLWPCLLQQFRTIRDLLLIGYIKFQARHVRKVVVKPAYLAQMEDRLHG